jgi:hypothetical protein
MATRPVAWRVLAVLSGPCLDAGGAPEDLGAVGELADMVGLGAEVRACQCHQPRRSRAWGAAACSQCTNPAVRCSGDPKFVAEVLRLREPAMS